MKTFIVWAVATFFIFALPWMPVQAANAPTWCANSGYDNGPPRERGPGTGLSGWAIQPIAGRSGATATTGELIPIQTSAYS
jgi:hypothetical protein